MSSPIRYASIFGSFSRTISTGIAFLCSAGGLNGNAVATDDAPPITTILCEMVPGLNASVGCSLGAGVGSINLGLSVIMSDVGGGWLILAVEFVKLP